MKIRKNSFHASGADIAFYEGGAGKPIVLVHGFASNAHANWINTGWFDFLVDQGRRVIALDCRGHGQSSKLYEAADYTLDRMAGDVVALIEHLALDNIALMGFSMGARISAYIGAYHGSLLSRLILAGYGANLMKPGRDRADVIEAFRHPEREDVEPMGRQFRAFALSTGSDLQALVACMESTRMHFTPDILARIQVPVLVVVGEKDDIAGEPGPLAAALPRARAVIVPKRDHMRTVGDPAYRAAVAAFLREDLS